MKPEIIAALLQKYFDGATDLEEEIQLKNYFESENIDNQFKKYKKLFDYLKISASKTLSDAATEQISAQWATPQYPTTETDKKPTFLTHFSSNWAWRAAAAVVVSGGLWWATTQSQLSIEPPKTQLASNWEADTEESPEVAYEKAKAALLLISKKMKKGTKTVEIELAKVKKSVHIIEE
jgi:hypothetical protein